MLSVNNVVFQTFVAKTISMAIIRKIKCYLFFSILFSFSICQKVFSQNNFIGQMDRQRKNSRNVFTVSNKKYMVKVNAMFLFSNLRY